MSDDPTIFVNDGKHHGHEGMVLEAALYTAVGLLLQGIYSAAADLAPTEAKALVEVHDRAMRSGRSYGTPDRRAAKESSDALTTFAKAAERTHAARCEMGSDWRRQT